MSFDKVRNSHKENNEKTSDTTATTLYLNFSFYKSIPNGDGLMISERKKQQKSFVSIEVANTKMRLEHIPH